MEARRVGGREPDGRRRRQALCGAALPTGCQGPHGRIGGQSPRGLPRQHQRPRIDDADNYGGIGAVIGPGIGHGFDDQGAKYDGDGNLIDWWTDEDRDEFDARTKALIEQYAEYTPRALGDGHHVNGAFTVGENIGDLGGLSIALLAYKLSLKGADGPVVDGLTGVQRVFYGWAQVWRTKSRDAEVMRRLAVDPHSPPEFRCNGVIRNVDAFYDAFDVAKDDALYLKATSRVRIWN